MGLPPGQIELIRQAGIMHDIGKLGCHANLNKPEGLTEEEYENVKLHPVFGREILQPIEFLHPLIAAVYHHHERWDGNGYPEGLTGESIPRAARILSVADAYDAMTSNRAYRKALPHKAAVEELQRHSGSQFDPEVVKSFLVGIERHRQECIRQGIDIPV
jgi:HD-GYP domain-containing protein (c-di-GMP phosphodiesterase class II)